jgi:4'-phosphopantetheinyl transferase
VESTGGAPVVTTGLLDVVVTLHPRGSVDDDRALVSRQVALSLGCDPRAVAVTRRCDHCGSTEHGRPVVAAPATAFASLSRAGALVAVAVSRTSPVGVDIESLDALASAGFDDVALTAAERALVEASGDRTLLRGLLWTSKEALLKATGEGLRVDPAHVGFDAHRRLVHWSARGARPRAQLAPVDAGAGYVGTVALVQGGNRDGVDPAVDDLGHRVAAGVIGERLDEQR